MFMAMNRLFVGLLPRNTTESLLEHYFTKYGELEEVLILYDRVTGNSKGYAFVSFTQPSIAQQVLAQKNHYFLGKKVDVKQAKPRGHNEQRLENQYQSGDRKIFVGGLADNLTFSELKAYFERFGSVRDAVIMRDGEGRSRGFGFVTFDSDDIVKNVLGTRFYELKNKTVEVKIAEPREDMIRFRSPMARTIDYDLYYRNRPWEIFDTLPYYAYGRAPQFYGVEPRSMYYPCMVNSGESSVLRVGTRSNVKVSIRSPNRSSSRNVEIVSNSVLEATCNVEKDNVISVVGCISTGSDEGNQTEVVSRIDATTDCESGKPRQNVIQRTVVNCETKMVAMSLEG